MRDSCRLSDGVVKIVSKDTRGLGFFAELARSAGEHEFIGISVFFWVKHIRAEQAVSYPDTECTKGR